MDEYRSNSNKSKEVNVVEQPERKIEKVVQQGSAKVKKKNIFRKFFDAFIVNDAVDIKDHIVSDVMVPAVKRTISDMMDMLLYKSVRRDRSDRAGGYRGVPYVSYESKYADRRVVDTRPPIRIGFQYDDIIFDTVGDATDVLDKMAEIIDHYGLVSVADMYEMSNIRDDNYTNNKYGWTNVASTEVLRVRDGYVLKLPPPKPLT